MNKNNNLDTKEIEQRARVRNNFRGAITLKRTNQKPCFEGEIRRLEDIHLAYNPDYPIHPVSYLFKEIPSNAPLPLALDALLEHEMIHKQDGNGRGCPNTEDKDIRLILTPISKALKKRGFLNVPFGNQGHTFYTYFANLKEDFIDNVIVADNRGARGLCLIYDDMGQHTGKFTKLFEGFVKLQAWAFPRKDGIMSLSRHFNNSPEAWQAVKNYLKRTGLAKVPREQRVNFLSNPENWEKSSEIFAEEFSKLVDKKDLAGSFYPVFGGNDFARLSDEDTQMELAFRAYQDVEGKSSGGQFEPPPYLEDNRALLGVYRKLAKQIDMKSASHSRETERPIASVSRRQFDFLKDKLEKLQYGLNARGKLEAQIGRFPITVRSRYQITAGTFPEIRIGLLDGSDSTRASITGEQGIVMNPWAKEDKQWTDKSIYHQELLTQFGLIELFRRHGVLKSSNVRLGNYSSNTRMARTLKESEEIALQPEFLGTVFNDSTLNEIFAGEGSFVYTISDGEIQNWSAKKERFIERAKKHHYVHLQVGAESQMYRDLKEAGLLAVLDDGRNCSRIAIDLTQRILYGGRK